jgi:opacity protein-like surface antigen
MRSYLAIAAMAALLLSPAALAQPANPKGNTPAVNTPNSPPNPRAPVAGANSFTEGQAKSRIESTGYTNVSGLRKDDQGVWRGMAMKDGRSVNVSLDFQGNVVAQ